MTRSPKTETGSLLLNRASKEMNPAKLMALVKELCTDLEDRTKATSPLTGQTPNPPFRLGRHALYRGMPLGISPLRIESAQL
jgi:hypothetical protein